MSYRSTPNIFARGLTGQLDSGPGPFSFHSVSLLWDFPASGEFNISFGELPLNLTGAGNNSSPLAGRFTGAKCAHSLQSAPAVTSVAFPSANGCIPPE
jgi:hypothetical protein